MKFWITLLAVGTLMLAAAGDSYAQKGHGHGGYGYGHGHAHGYGHGYGHMHGYPPGGMHHGAYPGHHPGGYHTPYDLGRVPVMPSPAFQAGPQTAAVTYPYYTTRGPRDFLQDACGPNQILPYRKPYICLPGLGP